MIVLVEANEHRALFTLLSDCKDSTQAGDSCPVPLRGTINWLPMMSLMLSTDTGGLFSRWRRLYKKNVIDVRYGKKSKCDTLGTKRKQWTHRWSLIYVLEQHVIALMCSRSSWIRTQSMSIKILSADNTPIVQKRCTPSDSAAWTASSSLHSSSTL